MIEKIKSLEAKHTLWRKECLNMIASENIKSHEVTSRLASDFGNRYINVYAPTLSSKWEALEEVKWYEGLDYIQEVEKLCYQLLKKVFKAEYGDYRPLSGNIAVLANWLTFSKVNDLILKRGSACGGHGLLDGMGAITNRRVADFPFDANEFMIDIEKTKKLIKDLQPKVLYFGGSQILFPEPLNELVEVARDIDAYSIYDGSHVLGLIAGGRFQDPLREGVTSLFGSTHKTFPGPQGGMTVSNASDDIIEKFDNTLLGSVIDNYHQNRVAALTVSLIEMLTFGEKYATQIISNTKTLGEALYSEGFPVICEHKGFSESHQVLVDMAKLNREGKETAALLAKANIIINRCSLPGDSGGETRGIRIGTQEMTRVGMKESEMTYIAELFRKCLLDKINTGKLKIEVRDFKKRYTQIHYSFTEGSEAYKLP